MSSLNAPDSAAGIALLLLLMMMMMMISADSADIADADTRHCDRTMCFDGDEYRVV